MASISDSQRGLDPGRYGISGRGTRYDPIIVFPRVDVRVVQAAMLQEAALNLGKIFLELRGEDRSLGDWALPSARTVMDERVLPDQLDTPTQFVLGSGIDLKTRIRIYDRYFDAVMPEVQKKAQEWGLKTLKAQAELLRLLWLEIDDNNFAAWMNKAAKEIVRRAGDCLDSKNKAEARKSGAAVDSRYSNPADLRKQAALQKRIGELMEMFKNCLVAAAKSFVASDKIESAPAEYLRPQIPFAKKVRYLQLLQILLAHPKLTTILLAYFDSAAKGTTAAKQLIRESSDAVVEFQSGLANSPRSVWRYPPLIVGGIQELGLGELAEFREYALAIGAVVASKTPETLLNYIGMGLFAIAFVSGVGTGAAILDFAIGGFSAGFSFVRERQQEQAMKASLFLPNNRKLATEFGYLDTPLALAFMLLAAIGLFRAAKAAAKAPSAAKPPKRASVKEAASRERSAPLPSPGPTSYARRLAQESEGTPPEIATASKPSVGARGLPDPIEEMATKAARRETAKTGTASKSKPLDPAISKKATDVPKTENKVRASSQGAPEMSDTQVTLEQSRGTRGLDDISPSKKIDEKSTANTAQGRENKPIGGSATEVVPFRHLETPDQVINALRDPRLFEIYKKSFYRSAEGIEASKDISDLARAIGKHAAPGKGGVVEIAFNISDALWKLPEHLRGTLIEKALGASQYRDWFNVGALDHGWFPQVDFAKHPPSGGEPTLVSVKSINPYSKSYFDEGRVILMDHIEDIVTGEYNFAKKGKGFRNIFVDVRVPQGTATPAADLEETLRFYVPPDLKKYITVHVREF